MKKLFITALALVLFHSSALNTHAALINVSKQNEITWNVLGAISFRDAKNNYIATSEIVLENIEGEVFLNEMDISNVKDEIIQFEKEVEPERVSIQAEGDNFLIIQRGVSAETSFPIKISESDDNIMLQTETGDRFIVILPYEALLQAIRSDNIEDINARGKIEIIESDEGEIAYKIVGTKKYSVFSFFDVGAEVNTYVSALTGNVIKVDQPIWSRVLQFLIV